LNGQSVRVRRYYEANTRWMLARGSGRGEGVIHRPVWLPGISSRAQAVRSVDSLILERLGAVAASPTGSVQRELRVLDLGCGGGATAVWLAERLPAKITGVTLSPRQVYLARRLAENRGTAERCRFVEGDFLDPEVLRYDGTEAGSAGFDGLYAIEAFSHAGDPETFLAQAARRLAPGGLLMLCDDFPSRPDIEPSAEPSSELLPAVAARRGRWIEAFRQGWHLGPLASEDEVTATAERLGFQLIERIDLSGYLRNRPVRARVAYPLLRALPARGPWVSSKRGGAALQICLYRQWVRYLFLLFRKH
jgi:SAM-dependent methyltransferase